MKITRDLVLSIILVVILSSVITRMFAPYIYNAMEGFQNKNLDVLGQLLNHIDIVDIKLRDENTWWEPKMTKAIKIKGLSKGLFVNVPLRIQNIEYNRGGLRLCDGDPCSDHSQWSLEFSNANDLLYRLYPKGHMPTKEVNERKRLIYTPGSWFARIFQNQSDVVNRPPPSWFSGSR